MANPADRIWSDVLSGDDNAWRELVRLYTPLVYTVSVRIGLVPMDAEDCTQQTWLALYRNRQTIKDPTRLPGWLARTAQRRALRMLQKARRDNTVAADQPAPIPKPLPDADLLAIEQRATLEIAIGQLDRRCAYVIEELFLKQDSTSYKEIAKQLGVTVNALGPIRSRCVKRLRKILEGMGYELH